MFHLIRYVRSGCAAVIRNLEFERYNLAALMVMLPESSLRYRQLAVRDAWIGVKIAFLRTMAKEYPYT